MHKTAGPASAFYCLTSAYVEQEMMVGTITDFHAGLSGRIGKPYLMSVMVQKHARMHTRADSFLWVGSN
jgi:uncharacterized protein YkvS